MTQILQIVVYICASVIVACAFGPGRYNTALPHKELWDMSGNAPCSTTDPVPVPPPPSDSVRSKKESEGKN